MLLCIGLVDGQVAPPVVCKMAKEWSVKHCKEAQIYYNNIFHAWGYNPTPTNFKIDWNKEWMNWIKLNTQWFSSTPVVLGMIPDSDVTRTAIALGCRGDSIVNEVRIIANLTFELNITLICSLNPK